jgi:uncharacterized membrane protein
MEDAERLHSLKNLATAVYALQVAGTSLESHFRWQIRTFWFGLLWAVLGCLLLIVVIGFAVLFADAVWIIYRIVKGWLNLNDNKPMPV